MKRMKMSQVRCGAVNPYALLASRTGKKTFAGRLASGRIREKCENEFRIPFHHLFDPVHHSPLFASGVQAHPPRTAQHIETGESASRCSQGVAGWAAFSGSFLPAKPPDVRDVNQGCSLNCWFMAALAAVAWVWPDFIKNFYSDTTLKTYLRFARANTESTAAAPYMPDGGLWTDTYRPTFKYYTSSYSLPYGSDGIGNWVYARPNPVSQATLWPALIEKNYANFYRLSGGANDTPSIATFGTGNPLNSLIHLTGKRYYSLDDVNNAAAQNVAISQTAFFTTEFSSDDAIFNTIYRKCYAADPTRVGSAQTSTPLVAWTYPTESVANTANSVDPVKNPEKSAKYANDAIVAQHAYSILGVHVTNGKKYIVLRNPWGMSVCGGYGADPKISDPTPADTSDDLYYSGMNESIITSYTGTSSNSLWTTYLPLVQASNYNTAFKGLPGYRTIDLRNSDGIFALAPDKFRWHFGGFGWVY